jgi:hypothetical protein
MKKGGDSVESSLTVERDKVEKEFKQEICLAFCFKDYEEENLALGHLEEMVFGTRDETAIFYSERIEALVHHFGDCTFEPAWR